MFTGREGLTAQGIPIENPVRCHSNWAGPLSTGPASPGSKTRIPEGPGGESCRRSRGEAFGKLEAENTPQWSRMHSSPETRTWIERSLEFRGNVLAERKHVVRDDLAVPDFAGNRA